MCDRETKINFRWSHVLEGVSILILIGLVTVVVEMRDSYHEAEDLHAKIPDGFFTKERYGMRDAENDRRFNRTARKALDDRIQVLERISTSHIQEAEIWKQTIRDTVESLRRLERLIWERERESDQ